MSNFEYLIPLVAVILSLGLPIAGIICWSIVSIRTKNRETELRKAIIENHVDAESIKLLIEEKEKTSNKFTMLRWGCILLGGGIGAFFSKVIFGGVDISDFVFWLPIISGMGLGMLVAFVIEWKLSKKEDEKMEEETKAP